MNYFNLLSRCFLMLLILIGSVAFADGPPRKLNYQGVLTSSTGGAITSPVNVTFSLYNVPTSGTAFWTETQSVTLANDGRFSVVLGSTTPLDPAMFTGETYIGVKVGSDTEMPRQQLTSVAYAFNAIPKGVIVMWSGALNEIPSSWALCDGNNGTPNLKDRFVVGAGNGYAVGNTGGTNSVDISHSHSIAADSPGTSYAGDHQHSYSGTTSINSNTDRRDKHDPNVDSAGSEHTHSYSGVTSVSGGHTHTVNAHSHYGATGVAGTTTLDNRPPYYALAYIMKL